MINPLGILTEGVCHIAGDGDGSCTGGGLHVKDGGHPGHVASTSQIAVRAGTTR